ncbi:hypothetical protein GW17_00017109 [Ensete ventricosum]|nr:hypothetical protein GW17_00017109 [Ensete ventricosum]RZS02505.1 hypothetical protein BHM03_00032576 [Ensete ventricosum]
MKEVVLHVYDVTNSGSEKTNNTILQINRIFKDRIGLGGIFHSAIQVSSSSSVPRFSFSSYKLLSFLFFSFPRAERGGRVDQEIKASGLGTAEI